MQTVTDLIDAARKALNVSSDAEFARQLGVSRGTIANWKSGYSLPDTVMCATLAGLTGLPLARVLGIVGEARAVSREEKAVWRKLAATAMALCLAVGFALPHKAQAAVVGVDKATLYTLCAIMDRPNPRLRLLAWQCDSCPNRCPIVGARSHRSSARLCASAAFARQPISAPLAAKAIA